MSLVNEIQNLCRDKNISISKLEKELNFGNGAIYRWDINSPSINKVIKVAQYFGVSLDSLILSINDKQNSA